MSKIRNLVKTLTPEKAIKTKNDYLITQNLVHTCEQFKQGKRSRIKKEFDAVKLFLFPRKTISFYPGVPGPGSVIFDLCAYLNYKIVKGSSARADREVMYYNTTFKDIREIRKGIVNVDTAINGECLDISKQHVQNCFKKSFGYALEMDPVSYRGELVTKSDLNYKHDGKIIDAPIHPSEVNKDYVYQKSIDNKYDHRYYLDYRVPIHGQHIPLVYKKYRPAEKRFEEVSHAEIIAPTQAFSGEEIKRILHFAALMKLDFGELDVLRDNNNQKIYIVDANDTPYHTSLSNELKRPAFNLLSKSFEKLIESQKQNELK